MGSEMCIRDRYWTTKNKTNTRERIELKKYDPVARKHVVYREER